MTVIKRIKLVCLALCLSISLTAAEKLPIDGNIFRAVVSGDISRIQARLRESPDKVTEKTKRGITPLHLAAALGKNKVCELLLKAYRLDVNAASPKGWTPFHLAMEGGHAATVSLLLQYGADVNQTALDGWNALHLAVALGRGRMASRCLQEGADINRKTSPGDTALMIAVVLKKKEMVRFLLEKGARTDLTDRNGQTAAQMARSRQLNEIETILKARP